MSRVLCVDDEPNMRRTLAANLRARGFDVDLAENGERAIELAKSKKPDVIILDLGLPGMSGLEVIRTLRHWTTIPIIVLSARDAEFDKIGALDAGADALLAASVFHFGVHRISDVKRYLSAQGYSIRNNVTA